MNAFDLPLATMRDEAFNQPIFGANNLTGTSAPLDGSSCHEDIKVANLCRAFQSCVSRNAPCTS
eukprot:6206726-Pleurochrysis_carterae.AAC.2